MSKPISQAQQQAWDALARLGGTRTNAEVAKEAKINRTYCSAALRGLVADGRIERAGWGRYKAFSGPPVTAEQVAGRSRGKGSREVGEVVQLLNEATAPLRKIIDHVQAIEQLMRDFKPGNAQAQMEVTLAAHHVVRAMDWMTGVVRPELPRPFGEESSEAVNRVLSGSRA